MQWVLVKMFIGHVADLLKRSDRGAVACACERLLAVEAERSSGLKWLKTLENFLCGEV